MKSYELEITRKEADEEMRKNNEHIKKLLRLLQRACNERDEAKTQLKKHEEILSFTQKPNFDKLIPSLAPFSPDSPLLANYPAITNSGITESNNSSKCQSQSHVSSPVVESLSYPSVSTSPDSSIMGFSGNNLVITPPTKVVDQGTLIIDNLAKGRPLPRKGKLLQAVIEAGPLLQTLLVSGSLPQWRNPPGSLTHQIPPVNIKGCDGTHFRTMAHKNVTDSNTNASVYGQVQVPSGSLGAYPGPIMDFGSGSSQSGSCLMGERFFPLLNFVSQIPKRQRLL